MGCGKLCIPFCKYDLEIGAVPSGRSDIKSPPLSSKVYVSFSTISVLSPTPLANNFESSIIGVEIGEYPNNSVMVDRLFCIYRHIYDVGGNISNVPLGFCSLDLFFMVRCRFFKFILMMIAYPILFNAYIFGLHSNYVWHCYIRYN